MTRPDFLPFALPDITEAEVRAVADTIRSGWLTTGPNAAAFEREFSDYLGGDVHAVAINSATAGLHLAAEAIGLSPGDEVLVPTWTFTATAEIVRYLGATPVFVDIEPSTLNIDLDAAAAAVTARTKAVIPVHFAGMPVPSGKLRDFATGRGLRVIEDAAHAFPVVEHGSYVGAGSGDATVFSFYATKTMTTGEGGMLVTRDPDLAARARIMRLHGISRDVFDRYTSTRPSWQYDVVAPGYKYNLTDTAAAMGRVQLARAEEMRLRRQGIADQYDAAFADLPLDRPARPEGPRSHAHHLYVIRLAAESPVTRHDFIELMAKAGVGTSVHFIPLHQQPYWRETYGLLDEHFPVASAEFPRVVSLPIFSSMSSRDVDRVIEAVTAILTRPRESVRNPS